MSWIRRIFDKTRSRFKPSYRWVLAEVVPEKFHQHTVYLVGEGEPWQAAFLCPCGCGARIQLSLVRDDQPRWDFTAHSDRKITLHPSVWRKSGCQSHFFLREGRILWARGLHERAGVFIGPDQSLLPG